MTSASEQKPELPPEPEPKPEPLPEPKPAPPHSRNGPVLLAAILGGLLGAVLSFVLARTFPAAPVPPPPAVPSEARQFADHVIETLQSGKNDEFMALLRPAFARLPDPNFAEFCKNVFEVRANALNTFGPGGQFEFFSESTISPTLVRVAYLEKYARGCMLWRLVVYNSPDGWQMSAFSFQTSELGFPMLQ